MINSMLIQGCLSCLFRLVIGTSIFRYCFSIIYRFLPILTLSRRWLSAFNAGISSFQFLITPFTELSQEQGESACSKFPLEASTRCQCVCHKELNPQSTKGIEEDRGRAPLSIICPVKDLVREIERASSLMIAKLGLSIESFVHQGFDGGSSTLSRYVSPVI